MLPASQQQMQDIIKLAFQGPKWEYNYAPI